MHDDFLEKELSDSSFVDTISDLETALKKGDMVSQHILSGGAINPELGIMVSDEKLSEKIKQTEEELEDVKRRAMMRGSIIPVKTVSITEQKEINEIEKKQVTEELEEKSLIETVKENKKEFLYMLYYLFAIIVGIIVNDLLTY